MTINEQNNKFFFCQIKRTTHYHTFKVDTVIQVLAKKTTQILSSIFQEFFISQLKVNVLGG